MVAVVVGESEECEGLKKIPSVLAQTLGLFHSTE